jgi:hypothetical protein
MRFGRVLSRSFALTIFALVLAGSAAAQQYQILRADYGYGNQRIDVTQRLRELARSNASFRMGNSTFGVDPSPGNVKTLRIHARGPGGKNRVFEYREGSIVDGSQFSGWGGGRWGDTVQYQILGAWYGTAKRNADVTQRLRGNSSGPHDRVARIAHSSAMLPVICCPATFRLVSRAIRNNVSLFALRMLFPICPQELISQNSFSSPL